MNEVLTDCEQKKVAAKGRRIDGIDGLQKYFGCSKTTAVKIGKSGKFPRYQIGRMIFFYEDEVMEGLSK